MDAFFDRCWSNFSWALNSLSHHDSRVLWSSLVWGRVDPAWIEGQVVSRLFFELGMIHVLVLSGSQVASFHKIQNMGVGLLLKWGRISRASGLASLSLGVCWLALGAYVSATGAAAPLVRAFIVLIVSEWSLGGGRLAQVGLSFVLHCALFPAQVGSLSFVLSWCAFLVLMFFAEIGLSRILSLCLLCVLSQALVAFVSADGGKMVLDWKVLVANVLLVPLFEVLVFPMGSLLACVVLWFSFGGSVWGESGLERRIFDFGLELHEILAQVLLGALKAIRYI